MDREDKLRKMIENYAQRRSLAGEIHVMEFHRKHLLLFLNRFRQLIARFGTPSSSLLSHEIFLIVEAATMVAKSDWEKLVDEDAARYYSFSKYLDEFTKLKKGLTSLENAACSCVEALTTL
jgi:hypothetical protein